MYINSVYLSTYSQDRPIDGYFEIKDKTFAHRIDFTVEEAWAIQEICSAALTRSKTEAAQQILSADIMPPLLPAPAVEEADYDEVPF